MRVADRPIPTSITLDPGALADWPVRPVFAIEQTPVPPYGWDDGHVWNDPAVTVWDAATVLPTWSDATCDFTGCQIEYGAPDDAGIFPAGRAVVQLDNRSGRWATYNVDGSPTDHGAGLQLWIWARSATLQWWLFAGRIARWDERADDTIEIEAFDYFSDLAQPVGTFTPGAAGDLPGARLGAIVTASGATLVRTRFATGTVHLTAQATSESPLVEMETVAASDGGLLYGDADGTVVSTDRLWRVGRADQVTVPVVGTNVCTAPVVLWDPVLSTSDAALAGTVVLENVAGLKATATKTRPGHYVVADSGQQWTQQAEGNQLAADLVAQLWQARLSIDTADLYLSEHAAAAIWAAVDWRRLDRIRILHDSKTPTGVARVDVEALIWMLTDEITPDGWVRSFGTTRALTYIPGIYWDQTAYRWNDPAAVWGY